MENDEKETNDDKQIENKWYRYYYEINKGLCNQSSLNKKGSLCYWCDEIFQTQLENFCISLFENNIISGNLKFFTLHNRQQNVFRADPNYQDQICWYDWAIINWSEEKIPAKLLLFMELEEEQFLQPFQYESSIIDMPGQYAIAYSIPSITNLQPAHSTSQLVQYGTIDLDSEHFPKLYIFHVDCIFSPISAVPYKVQEDVIKATEWIFLKPKSDWYSIFTSFITNTLKDSNNRNFDNNTMDANKKRKFS